MELTYGFVKPDAYRHRKKIEGMIQDAGMNIIFKKDPHYMARGEIESHYMEHKGKPFFSVLVQSVTGPTDQLIIAGENAVVRLSELAGGTDPLKAGPDTIRGRYGNDMPRNAFHRADSRESAAREIMLHLHDEKLPEEVMDWLSELGYLHRCIR